MWNFNEAGNGTAELFLKKASSYPKIWIKKFSFFGEEN